MDIIVKQKHIKVIQCERCGNNFTTNTNLRKHFNRKNICKPILKDISILELKEKYKIRIGVYICENCGKEYKSKVGKCKHKKKCLLNPIIIEKKELEVIKETNEELERKNEELKKQLLIEKSKREENAKVINNDNSTTNNTINFNFNDWDEEKLDHLLNNPNFIKMCLNNPINSIQFYLNNVNFDKDHPENKNIKITNLLSPYMDYMKEGKWNKIEKNILLPKIIKKSINTVDDIIDYNNEDSDDSDERFENLNTLKWNVYKSEIKKKI